MQPQFADASYCNSSLLRRLFPVFPHHRTQTTPAPRVFCSFSGGAKNKKKKENVWSVDNDIAEEANTPIRRRNRRGRTNKRSSSPSSAIKRARNSTTTVLVSAAMLTEIETVLQTQEPVIKPAWNTFASSVSGIWKGVGAVFSPFTAQMEPIGIGNQNENLFDCYTLSCIEKIPSDGICSHIRRTINWVGLNPFGESIKHAQAGYRDDKNDELSFSEKVTFDATSVDPGLPTFESFDFGSSEVLEEDSMSMELGLVFFEDGSYSRGPVDIPVGEFNESKYFISPTFKFEQCLVKGCHKRLRIVHTIEFNEGGSSIQITRVAVYEEQWFSPVNITHNGSDDVPSDLKPLSRRRRTQPSQLTGSWKVFEVSATPIFDDETAATEAGLPYVYLCTEALKKRSLPESSAYFGEEETIDVQDVTALWLPGGVTAYVDVREDGVLCIGCGWYSDEGLNLVMERDYGMDGKLKEVRWKTEMKRRWDQ